MSELIATYFPGDDYLFCSEQEEVEYDILYVDVCLSLQLSKDKRLVGLQINNYSFLIKRFINIYNSLMLKSYRQGKEVRISTLLEISLTAGLLSFVIDETKDKEDFQRLNHYYGLAKAF